MLEQHKFSLVWACDSKVYNAKDLLQEWRGAGCRT